MTGFRYGDFPMAPYTLRRSVISLVARPKIINRTNGSLFAQATVATTPLVYWLKSV
jgi:hypothetical protein